MDWIKKKGVTFSRISKFSQIYRRVHILTFHFYRCLHNSRSNMSAWIMVYFVRTKIKLRGRKDNVIVNEYWKVDWFMNENVTNSLTSISFESSFSALFFSRWVRIQRRLLRLVQRGGNDRRGRLRLGVEPWFALDTYGPRSRPAFLQQLLQLW